MKFYIYLFQNYNDNLVFNSQINHEIFYEGSLDNHINELKSQENKIFNLKIYPCENEQLNTTCLISDMQNHVTYMSPTSLSLFLNSNI